MEIPVHTSAPRAFSFDTEDTIIAGAIELFNIKKTNVADKIAYDKDIGFKFKDVEPFTWDSIVREYHSKVEEYANKNKL